MAVPADKTIAQLDPASTPENGDLLVLYQALATKKMTIAQLLAKVAQGVPNPPSLPDFCTAYRTSGFNIVNTFENVNWQASKGTGSGWWDIGTPDVITVPSSATHIRIHAGFRWADSTSAGSIGIVPTIDTFSPIDTPACFTRVSSSGFAGNALSVSSPPLTVSGGELIRSLIITPTGAFKTGAGAANSYLTVEKLA